MNLMNEAGLSRTYSEYGSSPERTQVPTHLDWFRKNDDNSPEHNLWFTVLYSFFEEASRKTIRDWEIDTLKFHARTRWMETVCSWVDVEQDFFVEKLDECLEKHRYTRERYRGRRERRQCRSNETDEEAEAA